MKDNPDIKIVALTVQFPGLLLTYERQAIQPCAAFLAHTETVLAATFKAHGWCSPEQRVDLLAEIHDIKNHTTSTMKSQIPAADIVAQVPQFAPGHILADHLLWATQEIQNVVPSSQPHDASPANLAAARQLASSEELRQSAAPAMLRFFDAKVAAAKAELSNQQEHER